MITEGDYNLEQSKLEKWKISHLKEDRVGTDDVSESLNIMPKGEIAAVIETWSKLLTPTPGDEVRQFSSKANIFNEGKMDRLDPATNINFWLKYGVRYWQTLEGEVLGKTNARTLHRDRIRVSSNLATTAAKKIENGDNFDTLTKAEKISMLLLTKAKLIAAEKMASNVYSELRSDFDTGKREVDRNLTELLVDPAKVTDINNEIDWNRVIPSGKMVVPTLLTLGTIVLAACATPPVKAEILPQQQTIEDKINVGGQNVEMTEAEKKQHLDELLQAGGTSIVVEKPTSEYVPGGPILATFKPLVSENELSQDNTVFKNLDLEEVNKYQLSPTEFFVYITAVLKGDITQVTYDVFHNPDVADYLASKEGSLNFFLVNGDEGVARAKLAEWCTTKGQICLSFEN